MGRGWRGDAGDRPVGDLCIVALELGEKFQGGFGACGVTLGLQAHAHDPVKGEGEEADERVRPDAVRQAVVDLRDLDVGFEDAEPALNIGKTLVARDSLCRADVSGIGNQGERAVEELGTGHSLFLHRPREAIGSQVGLEEPRQRIVEPYGVLFGMRGYLIAREIGTVSQFRQFRLDRISQAVSPEMPVLTCAPTPAAPSALIIPTLNTGRLNGSSHQSPPQLRGVLADPTRHPESLVILAARVVAEQTDSARECADAHDLLCQLDRRQLHAVAAAAFPMGGAA